MDKRLYMKKNFIYVFMLILFFISYEASAMDSKVGRVDNNSNFSSKANKIKIISSPNWIHPNLRKNYQGYTDLKIQKRLSPMWQYSTNRQSGNIKGGGTTKYKDYKPFYRPSSKIKD